jgi:uncharacterized lipoprotein YbaY
LSDTVTGTLTYVEPHELGPDAFAMVAIVRVDTAGAATVVASRRYTDPGPLPIAFALRIDQSLLDPTATYSLQATIVDGEAAWPRRKASRSCRTARRTTWRSPWPSGPTS